jgi:hypothetical protein
VGPFPLENGERPLLVEIREIAQVTLTNEVGEHKTYEYIDSAELASRWKLPVSWVRDQVRRRATDPLPHVRFGKYVRFRWGSPELEGWAERRIIRGSNREAGRALTKETQ